MKKYASVEEITEGFKKDGWKNPSFLELDDSHKNFDIFAFRISKGHKYFIMNGTGNIFDEHGKIALYNISACGET